MGIFRSVKNRSFSRSPQGCDACVRSVVRGADVVAQRLEIIRDQPAQLPVVVDDQKPDAVIFAGRRALLR